MVLWDIPVDVTKVSISVSGNPNDEPQSVEDELFTGKSIGVLGEGVNYVHVQFKNNIGWGKVSHYKISLDTTSPEPFEINITSFSDNPTPKITFKNEDSLSGYYNSFILIDDKEPIISTSTSLILPPQTPGKHKVVVRMFDKAGNSVEDDAIFEILPLKIPTIDFVTERISQEGTLFITGNSIGNSFVDIFLYKNETEIFSTAVNSDISGKWKSSIREFIPIGEYSITISARDDRGAISYKTKPVKIRVTAKSILSIGSFELTLFEILIIVVLIILLSLGFGSWYYFIENQKKIFYKIIIARDIKKINKLLEDNIQKIEYLIKDKDKITPTTIVQVESILKKMKGNTGKMLKYLSEQIRKTK